MPPALLAYDPPLVREQALRQELIAWFTANADAWERQADGCLVWGTEQGAAVCRGKAAVCRQYARDLDLAVYREATYPEAWKPFVKEPV